MLVCLFVLCDHVVRYAVPTIVRASPTSLFVFFHLVSSIGVFLLNSIEAEPLFLLGSIWTLFFWFFLLDLYVLFLLGSIWALSLGYMKALSSGFYIDSFC